MNKIKFDAKLIDLFSEDFDYLQSSIETEIYKIFKQVTTYNGAAAIVKGFTLAVSTTDPTTLMLSHSGPFGSLVSKTGVIYESSGTIDNIALTSPTLNSMNYVFAVLESIEGSYNRVTKTFVANQKKAIDLSDYSEHYDRIQDSWAVEVYSQSEYSALTPSDLEKRVYLGRIAASGLNQPLTNPVDLTGRNIIKTHIQPQSITTDMISQTGLMLPQNQVANSLTINDAYSGSPITTQDDFNKIRTHIKNMKGTLKWDDESPTTLFDFDRSINAVHENGVFRNKDQELQVVTHTGNFCLEVKAGCANVNGGISRVLVTSTGKLIYLPTPVTTTIGGTKYLEGELRGQFLGTSYQFYIYNHSVTPDENGIYQGFGFLKYTDTSYILITDTNNGPNNGDGTFGFKQNVDYTVVEDTGLVSITSQRMRDCWLGLMPGSGGISQTNDKLFKCFYKYGDARWDAVTIGVDNEIVVFSGTPGDSPTIPVTNSEVVNLAYVYVKPFDTSIDPDNIYDTRFYIDKVRETIDVPVMSYTSIPRSIERINYYTSTGVVQTSLTSTGTATWKVMNTSTGDYCAYTSTKGAYLETVVYSKKNDEIWLITDKTPWVNNVSISYTLPNSNTYTTTIATDLFFNTRLAAYPVFIDNNLEEGYVKIRLTINNITPAHFRLYKIIIGKLDLFYNKHSLSDVDYIVPQKITNFSGMNAKAYLAPRISNIDNIRKGRLLLNTSTKEFCGYDGRQLNYWDVEQKYPISRVGNFCTSTGYTTSTGYNNTSQVYSTIQLLSALGETVSDVKSFFYVQSNIIGAINHQRVAFCIQDKGAGYTHINLVIHDSLNHIVGTQVSIEIASIINGYNYFELPATLKLGEQYHYHLWISGTATTIPSVRCRTSGVNDKKLCLVQFYTPTAGQYKSNNVLNLLNSDGTALIAERLSTANAAGNRYDLNTLDLMAVDFSNDTIWENWEYNPGFDLLGGNTARYIGVDIKTGRIKMPVGYDIRDYFVEYNVKELGTKTDAKSSLIHGESVSISDAINNIKQGSDIGLNGIINGSFDIWQRVRKGSTDWLFSSVADGEYTADMFRTYINGGTSPVVNISRVSGDPSQYAMRLHLDTLTSGTVNYGVCYRMPTSDSLKYYKKKVTISLDLRKGSTQTSDILLELFYTTTADTFSSVTSIGTFTIPIGNLSTTSFRRFSNTFDLTSLTSMKNIMLRITTSATGAVTSSANRYLEFQNIQLNEGGVSLPFQNIKVETTLQSCLPFYEKSYDYSIAPGTATNLGSFRWVTRTALAASTGGYQYPGVISFEKKKYATPTSIVVYSEAGTANAMTVGIVGTTGIGGSDRTGVTTSNTLGSSQRTISTVILSSASTTAITADQICGIHYVSKVEL